MLGTIIAGFLGLASGFGIAWLIIRKLPQDKIREINYQRLQQEELQLISLEEKRQQAMSDYDDALQNVEDIKYKVSLLTTQKDMLSNDITHLANQRDDISKNLEQSKRNAEKTAQEFFKQNMALAQEQLDRALEQTAQKFQNDEELYRQTYLQVIKEYAEQFASTMAQIQQEKDTAQLELEQLQNAVNVAVASAKREEEKRQAKNFYRLVLPESDINEISQLRSVEPFLRDKEALNKVIWKVYYEKPYTDLIGRVVGPAIKTGIYKITNIENQMCYVGQAVNIADRWKQHIKRGIGAEAPTRNKLYPAMLSIGVENFTFEILEECDRDKLDIQEDYWQEFYHAKDFGYSIK